MVKLTWNIERTDPNGDPINISYYLIQVQKSRNGTFDDIEFDETNVSMFNGSNEYREEFTDKNLKAGTWYYRIRILKKPDEVITEFTDPKFVDIAEGLGTPSLNITPSTEIISNDSISISVGAGSDPDVKPSFDLYYDTNLSNVNEQQDIIDGTCVTEFCDKSINGNLHTVQLAGVFEPGERIYFMVQSLYQGQIRSSQIKAITYDPDVSYPYFVPHVSNNDSFKTSLFINYEGEDANYVEFTALVKSGAFGNSGSPQTNYTTFLPKTMISVNTDDIFPDIHKRGIRIKAEQPLDVSVQYFSTIGDSTSMANVKVSDNVSRDLKIDGLYKGYTQYPGAAISNMTAYDGVMTVEFIYVHMGELDPQKFSAGQAALPLKPYETTVFTLDDHFDIPMDVVGTLYISANVNIVGVGSVMSGHGTFGTIDFVQSN